MNTNKFELPIQPFTIPENGSNKHKNAIDPWRLVHFYAFAIFFSGAFILQAGRSTQSNGQHQLYEAPQLNITSSSRSRVLSEALTPFSLDLVSFSEIIKCTELHDGSYCYNTYSDDSINEISSNYGSNVSNSLNSCFQTAMNTSNDIPLLSGLQSCIINAVLILDNSPQVYTDRNSKQNVQLNGYCQNINIDKSNHIFFSLLYSMICILLFINFVNSRSIYYITTCFEFFKKSIIVSKKKFSSVLINLKAKSIEYMKLADKLKNQASNFSKEYYCQVNQFLEIIIEDHKRMIELLIDSLCESINNEEPDIEIKNEELPVSDYESNESLTESSSKSHILQVSSPVDGNEKMKPFQSASSIDINRSLKPEISHMNHNRIVLGEISSSISPDLLQKNYKFSHYNLNSQNSLSYIRGFFPDSLNKDISPLVIDSANQDKALKVAIDKKVFNLNTIEGRLQWSEYMLNKKKALKLQTANSAENNISPSTTGANTDDSSAGIQNHKGKCSDVSNSGNKIIESIFLCRKEDDKENISIDEFNQIGLVSKAMEVLNKPVNKISDIELQEILPAIKLSEFNKISTIDRNGKQLRRILIPGVGWRSSKFFKRLHEAFNL